MNEPKNDVFDNGLPAVAKASRLNIKERLGSYKNIPRFFKLVWKISSALTVGSVSLRVFQAVIPIGLLSIGKHIIDQAINITQNKSLAHDKLWNLLLFEFLLVVLLVALGKFVTFVDELIAERLTNETTNMIMSHAAELDLVQFENSLFYDKLDRARQQTSGRAILITHVFSQVQDIITILSFVTVLIFFSPWILPILAVALVPSIVGEYYFNKKNYLLVRSQTQGRRELDYLSLVASSDATAKEVRLFDLSGFFVKRFKKIAKALYRDKFNFGLKKALIGALITIPGTVGFYFVVTYIIEQVIIGKLSIGGLTFMLATIRQLGAMVQSSAKRFSAIAQGAIYLTDFFDFFKIMPAIKAPVTARQFPEKIVTGFTFENVGFKYANSSKWANRHLNFTLRPGEKLALVGENGAGKTTLIKLLVRLYDPTEGRVLLDGYDLKEYDVKAIREQMGVIFQDFIRYQMSAAENIAVGNLNGINEPNLMVAAAKQSLAHDVIEKMPNKYQQILGHYFEGGFELSGGEWQKVALSRAYMRDAQIVILDEPTAALDARSEFEVFKRFSHLSNGKTTVLISHRFSTVRLADRIIVLNKGEIAEIGSHDELLNNEGRYAELFRLQAAGYK